MTKYADDRCFTDFVHQKLALPLIYSALGWKETKVSPEILQKLDIESGIDYVFTDSSGLMITVQERFRDDFYRNYKDCTLRFRRDHNPVASRHKSEYYKVKADFLVYGITNGPKFADKRHLLTGFTKFAVINLNVLYDKIRQEKIITAYGRNSSHIENGRMLAAIKENSDASSNFVVFDIAQLNQLFGNEDIILFQKGFYSVL
jgi:hypothetical protein